MKTKMPTLSEATRVVYKRRKNGTKSATNFLIGMKHNIKALGDLPVNKITRPMVNKMMDILKQEHKNSNAVVNQKMGYLRVVLQEMEEDGYIEMIKMPKPRPTKNTKVHYLTEDMERELLSWLNCMQRNREAKDIVECLIDLGCRVNELLGLEKRFVDFDNNQINFNDRKNDQAVAVPMTNRVQSIIRRYYREVKDFDRLFTLNYSELNAIWQKARKDLGYADKKFYTLHLCRHTTASRLVQRGVPILLVKDWLGHEDIENTMIYAHLQPKALHSIVDVLNDRTK
jgi:integrase